MGGPTSSAIVHTTGSPATLLKVALAAVARPGLAPSAWLVETNLQQRSGPPADVLLGVADLSSTATFLSGPGIFGLIAYAAASRTREIGVRIALGARASNVIGTLVAQYAMALISGVAVGIALAQAAALLIESRVAGLRSPDFSSYTIALPMLGLVWH
jgi:hypothetical protein